MYGDFVTVIEAPELNTKVAIFASVTSGATAERTGRGSNADEANFLVDDHVLDDAAGIVGDTAVVADGEFEFTSGHDVAALLHVEFDRRRQLPAHGIKSRSGQRDADPHFENFFGTGSAAEQCRGCTCRRALKHRSSQHCDPLPVMDFFAVPALTQASVAQERQAGSRCGICGRSPSAFPVIGALGRRAVPASITKLCASEYQGGLTSAAGAGPSSWRTKLPSKCLVTPN